MLFKFKFKFGCLTNVNIFRKTKLRIKREIRKNDWNLVFNTIPIKVEVYYKISRDPKEARRIRKEYYARIRGEREPLRMEREAARRKKEIEKN